MSVRVEVSDIIKGLVSAGVKPGDGLAVHSSLKSFGRVEGGPGTVIRALQEALTPAGTLVMPSFNHGSPFREGGEGFFDPMETPTSNGAVPEAFRRMPGVSRSLNPTHPFSAWGREAAVYTEGHHRTLTMGADSPLGLLFRDGGSCLLMGVDYSVNTFHHVVETMNRAPCLGLRTEAYPVKLPGGRMVDGRTWSFRSRACPLTPLYGRELEAGGLTAVSFAGNSRFVLFRLADCFKIYSGILREGAGGHPPCRECRIRPGFTGSAKAAVASDWDEKNNRIKPGSGRV